MNNQSHEYTIAVAGPSGQEPIAVLRRSGGTHPFVAWHGITAVNRFWFWDVLWPHGAVSLVGLPGHGPLPPRPTGHARNWTPQHFIDVGIATLRTLTHNQPATVIGHSTGGMIALSIAHHAPELVERLVLIAPVVWSDLTGIVGVWQRFARYPRLLELVVAASLGPGRCNQRLFIASLRAFIADRRGFYTNAKVAQAIRDGYSQMQRTPIRAIAETTRVLRQVDLRPLIQSTPASVPTLLIHGEDDPIIPIAQSEWLAAALPHAQFVRMPGVGHLPYAEHEAETNQIIKTWVERHPVSVRA